MQDIEGCLYFDMTDPKHQSNTRTPICNECGRSDRCNCEASMGISGPAKSCFKHASCIRCRRTLTRPQALLPILLLTGIAIGVLLGSGLRQLQPPFTRRQIAYLRFPGELMLQILKMFILPITMTILISSMASLNVGSSGRMGVLAIIYYISSSLVATLLAVAFSMAIRPGENQRGSDNTEQWSGAQLNPLDTFLDLIRNLFPDNLIEACFRRKSTMPTMDQTSGRMVNVSNSLNSITSYLLTWPNGTHILHNSTNASADGSELIVASVPGTNMLGLMMFSIAVGCTISKMGKEARILAQFFEAFSRVVLNLVQIAIWFMPVGVLFLAASIVVEVDDLGETAGKLGMFLATSITGYCTHGLVVLPIVYFVFVRKNPFKFVLGMVPALITVFTTRSSAVTLPVTLRCLNSLQVDYRVVKFIAPIGASINMDGTALYETTAAIFIAQLNNISLSIGQLIAISISSTAASIGAAAIPGTSLVIMPLVLMAAGLPTKDITLLATVDWISGCSQSWVNVLSDGVGAAVIESLIKKERLDQVDRVEMEEVLVEGPEYEQHKKMVKKI